MRSVEMAPAVHSDLPNKRTDETVSQESEMPKLMSTTSQQNAGKMVTSSTLCRKGAALVPEHATAGASLGVLRKAMVPSGSARSTRDILAGIDGGVRSAGMAGRPVETDTVPRACAADSGRSCTDPIIEAGSVKAKIAAWQKGIESRKPFQVPSAGKTETTAQQEVDEALLCQPTP